MGPAVAGRAADGAAGRGPNALRAAGLLLVLEAVAALVATGVLGVATATGAVSDLGRAGFGIVAGLVVTGGLLRVGRGVVRVEEWARAPAVVAQLLLLPVGWTLAVTADRPAYGGPLLVVCVAELALLFSPPARAAYDRAAG